MAKAGKKHITPRPMVRELAKNPDFVTVAKHFNEQAKVKEVLDRATASIFGSIERHQARMAAPAPILPTSTAPVPASVNPTGAGAWVKTEFERMRDDGEIPKGVRQVDLAKLLAGRMKKAADASGFVYLSGTDKPVRKVDWRHIKNNLRKWGIWPV